MKPFDLEKALAGEPVVTRSGVPVTEIYHFKTSRDRFPVRAVVNGGLSSYNTDGRWGITHTNNDLFMAPVKKQEWVNIHKNDCCYFIGFTVFDNERSAVKAGSQNGNYIKSVLVSEWEE